MNKNKKNLKGFTLVELIIVSTIMVMIMGAVLNFIQPLNRFYQRTQNLADGNDIGNIIMDTVDNNLRYATNMMILEDYSGVPLMQDGYLKNSSGTNAFDHKFTNVIIIDNGHPRGKTLDSYDPDVPAAHAKGALGSIMSAPILSSGDGIDFTHLDIIGTEDIYSDFRARFNATLNVVDEKNKCVNLSMQLWKPELNRDTGVYEFNKEVYNQSRDLELVNINMNRSSFKVECYTGVPHEGVQDIDYNRFPRSGETSTVTNDGQRELFTTGFKTYIFYSNEASAESASADAMVGLREAGESSYLVTPQPYPIGSTIPEADLNTIEAQARSLEGITNIGGVDYRVELLSIKVDGQPSLTLNDFRNGKTVSRTFDFIATYNKTPYYSPVGDYVFYELDPTGSSWVVAEAGAAQGDILPASASETDGSVPMAAANGYTDAATGDEKMPHNNPVWRWREGSTYFDPTAKYSGHHEWYCEYLDVPMAEVTFKDETGGDVLPDKKYRSYYQVYDDSGAALYEDESHTMPKITGYQTGVEIDADADAVASRPTSIPAGKEFKGWHMYDTTGGAHDDKGMLQDMSYLDPGHTYDAEPYIDDAPTDFSAPVVAADSTNAAYDSNPGAYQYYWPMWTYTATLTYSGTDVIKGAKFDIIFNEEVGTFDENVGFDGATFGNAQGRYAIDATDKKVLHLTVLNSYANEYYGVVRPGDEIHIVVKVHPMDKHSTSLDIDEVKCTGVTAF